MCMCACVYMHVYVYVLCACVHHSQRSLENAAKTIGRRSTFDRITDDEVKITGTAITHLAHSYSRKCGALMQH